MQWKDFLEIHKNIKPDEDIACIIWTRPDVYGLAEQYYPDVDMTDEIADAVLANMDDKADCEYGMSWDTLKSFLEYILNERELI